MIQFLLDTNIIIWLSEENPRINKMKNLLFSEDAEIFISSASWWEMAIKKRIKKLNVDFERIRFLANKHHFLELPITDKYIKNYLELPKIHNDPFDHMMLAQAIYTPMRLITGDAILAEYSSLVMVI